MTPEIRVDCPDTVKFQLVQKVQEQCAAAAKAGQPLGAAGPLRELVTIDGVRAIFEHGWGLIRASNTQPALVLRFEATSQERLNAIRAAVEAQLDRAQQALGQ